MKLATVEVAGRVRCGAIVDDGFIDLSSRIEGCDDLRTLLVSGSLDEARTVASSVKPDYGLDEVALLPPNPRSDMRMFALGWAYKAHQTETGADAPEFPMVFSKHPQSLVGHGRPLVRPRCSTSYDFEGEIAIVIGRGGRDIPAGKAREHIAGYSLVMDGSARDYQKHSVTAGKNFDASSAFGPWLVTADEVGDPLKLQLTTRLNGEVVQSSGFELMAWDLGYLINYLSTVTRLEPGDVISTGTPAGVGALRKPPLFMQAGDVIEVEAPGIGTLRNTVVEEPEQGSARQSPGASPMSATIRPKTFAHVVYRTYRYEEMRDWYMTVFEARLQFDGPVLSFMTYDDEHHRVALINLAAVKGEAPPPAERDVPRGRAGVDHVAYGFSSLRQLLEKYDVLKKKAIKPYWCIHHGVTVSLYYADPDGNQMEFQVDCFDSNDAANAFIGGPNFEINPIGVEYDPDAWLARLRAGEPEQIFLPRMVHLPVSEVRGSAAG